jgi:hypothetical protein
VNFCGDEGVGQNLAAVHGLPPEGDGCGALFTAAAILTETVSCMAFDDGAHGLSQQLSIQSLALAKHAGDTAVDAMS